MQALLSSNRKITITPTETPLSPFTTTPGELMSYWLDAATKVANATTTTYIAGLNAIVEQQKVAHQASLKWLSEATSAQSDVNNRLVESYDPAAGDLTEVADKATPRARPTGAEAVKRSRNAATSASKTQTTRAKASTRSKPARSTAQPGPARWTGEAYESLTAAEVNEKLPQFSQRELREVETYEKAHESRQTVLDKISSLYGQPPVPGYDELNVPEIQQRLAEGDDKLAASVRDYERPRKNRDGVLHAADTRLNQS